MAAEVAGGTGSELHVVYVDPLPGFMTNSAGKVGYDRALCTSRSSGRSCGN
ncbi:hypothetical protein [Rubrobacter taiwanensis]|jgi:hypothetical protein|uniref:hypothetical protein n=1 Tax=Rubrobacter taiwanensis TaxID=185139 RepID=UPI0014055A89|nr:hypothetical protein [Rubrobacter taiwanensis]